MARFSGKIIFVYPESGVSIYINGVDYSDYVLNYGFTEKSNEIGEFFIDLIGIESSERTDVARNKIVRFVHKANLLFKGKIGSCEYKTGTEASVKGVDLGSALLKDRTVKVTASAQSNSPHARPIYDDVAVSTIISEQLSSISSVSVDGSNNGSGLGSIKCRGDYSSVLSFLHNIVTGKQGDWWFSYNNDDGEYAVFNASGSRGSGSSVQTYNISGDNQNANRNALEEDFDNLYNSVTVTGYSDGVNQLYSKIYDASDNRTVLASSISDSDTSATVVDGSVLPSSGTVWIGMEQCSFTRSGNTLTITRATANGTDGNGQDYLKAYAHKAGTPVWDAQYTEDSFESGAGSSIETHGVREHVFTNKSIFDQDFLDTVAYKIFLDHKDLVKRILVYPSDPYSEIDAVNVGDSITINDSEANMSGEVQVVVGKKFSYDTGLESLELEVADKKTSLTGDVSDVKKVSEVQSNYMQGATNIFVVNETENVESGASNALDLFFEIPSDAVAINSVKLAYRNEAPRIYQDVTTSSEDDFSNTENVSFADIYSVSGDSWSGSVNHTVSNETGIVICYAQVTNTSGADASIYLRIENITDSVYYPDTNGVAIRLKDGKSGFIPIIIPKNLNGKQINWELKTSSASGSADYNPGLIAAGKHSHDSDYNITPKTYTTSDVSIYTSNNASGSPSWTDRTADIESVSGTLNSSENGSETGLDLTGFFSGTGWKGIRIQTNGNSRHKAQVVVKCLVESRT